MNTFTYEYAKVPSIIARHFAPLAEQNRRLRAMLAGKEETP